jgi:cytochrome P450
LPGFPVSVEGLKQSQGGGTTRTLFGLDNPRHDVLRKLFARDFMVKKINQLRPLIQKHVDDLIEQMLAGPKPVDFVASFALPLPTLVISDILGIPHEDQKMFQEITDKFANPLVSEDELSGATIELATYVGRLIDIKLDAPRDDMLSRLAAYWGAGQMTREEAISGGVLLIPAGHETSANMITLSTIALLENPDQLDEIRSGEDPELMKKAIEELLRYLHIAQYGRRRIALADIEISGQVIAKGDGVILPGSLADRESGVFEGDPDVLDIHRDARHHLAFGYGIHQCLGQPLVRAELQIVYSTLFRRIPTLRLTIPREQIPFKSDRLVFGAHALPVTW